MSAPDPDADLARWRSLALAAQERAEELPVIIWDVLIDAGMLGEPETGRPA